VRNSSLLLILCFMQSYSTIRLIGQTDKEHHKTLAFDCVARSWKEDATVAWQECAFAQAVLGSYSFVFGGLIGDHKTTSRRCSVLHNGKWTDVAEMPTSRCFARAAVVGNTIFVIGGRGDDNVYLHCNEAYSVAANRWTVKAELPESLRMPAIAAVAALCVGRIFIFDSQAAVFVYDPTSDAYEALDVQVPEGGLPIGACAAVFSDSIFLLGG